jgi:drug/metabolite transporter (DMT)-like permease
MENHTKIKIDASVAGPLFMLSSALLFTAMNIIVKLLNPAFTVWHIGFFRFFGGAIILLTVFGRKTNLYRGNNIRLLIIRGCVGTVAFISMITSIRILPVSTALVIFYSFPVFAAIASFIIYKERIGKLEIGCMMTVIIGVGVLLEFKLGTSLFGQFMALLGGVFAGLTVTFIRTLRVKNGPAVIYLYFCTMGMLACLPMFVLNPIMPVTAMEWAMVLGIVFTAVTAQLLMNQGFFYCRGWEGGVFMSSEVIFTAIVGIVFLGDPVSWRFWTGGCLILGSVIALNRLKAEKQIH